jgi:hypothetical protein
MMDQDTFIEQYVTQFLATHAANEYGRMGSLAREDHDYAKQVPVQKAIVAARYAWAGLLAVNFPHRLAPSCCVVGCTRVGLHSHNTGLVYTSGKL